MFQKSLIKRDFKKDYVLIEAAWFRANNVGWITYCRNHMENEQIKSRYRVEQQIYNQLELIDGYREEREFIQNL